MIIELNLKKSLSALAGYSYGEEIYISQVEDKLGEVSSIDKIEIIIPEHIEYLASSFVQGFFSKLIEKIGFSGIEKLVEIKSDNENITTENVINKLFEGTKK
ncbi:MULTISPECIES: DUF4325 domain-containing protein [Lactococcus]|uniref:DUF4325 domain-containing protein n=1 Tax=Lactococcus TaxID=1357 RepID=UPI0013FD71E8|nr:hypothetical protein [Lactococcus garvieae]